MFNVSFKAYISLFIFILDDLSSGESGVLKSPTMIVLLSISPFMAVVFVFGIEVLLCWEQKYLQLVDIFSLLRQLVDFNSVKMYVVALFLLNSVLYHHVYFLK